jgi:pyruvate formate lyase activating enzyme
LKGFSEQFYREVTGATLKGVLEGLEAYKRLGIWIEITTLVIPGHNDDQAQLAGIARFIADHLGVETPWHVTAFHPVYRMREKPATPHETLHRARNIGLDAGLKYVYEGNIEGGDDTFCPGCRRVVIERQGFRVKAVHLKKGRCLSCQHPLDGVGF